MANLRKSAGREALQEVFKWYGNKVSTFLDVKRLTAEIYEEGPHVTLVVAMPSLAHLAL